MGNDQIQIAIAIEIDSATLFDKIQLTAGSLLALGTNLTDLQLTLGATPTIGGIFRIVDAAALPASYEDALQELENLVRRLESGEMPLDQLLSGYQRGAALRARLGEKIRCPPHGRRFMREFGPLRKRAASAPQAELSPFAGLQAALRDGKARQS